MDKKLFAPRLGLAYRINDNTVFRAGYGRTFNPLPWSRPMRGFYPATIAYSDAGPISFIPYGTLANGIPGAPNPDIASGNIPLPRGVAMRSPDPDDVKRGSIAVVEHVHRASSPARHFDERRLRRHGAPTTATPTST